MSGSRGGARCGRRFRARPRAARTPACLAGEGACDGFGEARRAARTESDEETDIVALASPLNGGVIGLEERSVAVRATA